MYSFRIAADSCSANAAWLAPPLRVMTPSSVPSACLVTRSNSPRPKNSKYVDIFGDSPNVTRTRPSGRSTRLLTGMLLTAMSAAGTVAVSVNVAL